MALYSIKDLERLSGIKAHTIRIWEKRYGLMKPVRTSTNIRTYGDGDLKKILNVSILNRNGIKISRIVSLQEQEIQEKVLILTQDSGDFDSLIENLVIAMIDMDEEQINSLLSRAIMQTGFEECILNIIYPFFEKIGVLWQTGTINPAQEHFVSNLIRQKLIVGINSLIPFKIQNPKHFLLFLPEGELHELGLLFYSYFLQKRGHKVTYLGQWLPFDDMLSASSIMNFDCLLTSVISVYSGKEFITYLEKLSTSFPDKTIFISGRQIENLTFNIPSNMIFLHKADNLLPHLS